MAESGSSSSRARKRRTASDDPGEFAGASDVRTALIEGGTFGIKAVQYAVVDGNAIVEGDIDLGPVDEVEHQTELRRQVVSGQVSLGVVVTGANRRWPNCQIPYDIDPALPNQTRVMDAIAHWEANTSYRFVVRSAANAAEHPDWVTFRPGNGCSSAVGRQGGQQFVTLATNCLKGQAIHEIGHVVGLWHEQSREDRDAFVTIHWDKILPGMEHNFNQHITDGDDVGAYDYDSIMHYPRAAFSVDQSDTITPIVPGAAIGQRTGLSAGDIAAATSLCKLPPKPAPTDKLPPVDHKLPPLEHKLPPIDHKPPVFDRKLPVLDHKLPPVDHKLPVLDGHKWPFTTKEQVHDTRKELVLDKGPRDVGGGTLMEQVGPTLGGGGATGPFRGPLPFAMAAQPSASEDPSAIPHMDAQLQQLAVSLAALDGDRDALQAQYDQTAAALAAAITAAQGS